MILHFHKYQGTGNDFIMVDQRKTKYLNHEDYTTIERLCDRRFGIGADGLILLEEEHGYDFKMVYFNADGKQGSMCGNGGRCIIAFAHALGIFKAETNFIAVDGPHHGKIKSDHVVSLQMQDVHKVKRLGYDIFELNTGSPHYIAFCNNIPQNVVSEGQKIRYSDDYQKEGINVNFTKVSDKNKLEVATYERGVEDETYSCGTGVTAAALSYGLKNNLIGTNSIQIKTKGGHLEIQYHHLGSEGFTNIWLSGPALKVFEGEIEC